MSTAPTTHVRRWGWPGRMTMPANLVGATSTLRSTFPAKRKRRRSMLKLYEPYEFHMVNAEKTTHLGNLVGYKVVPVGTAAALLGPNDPPQLR
ncbi:Primary amine oxidase [Platanthera guangdongensis]|uniref:Primary amine oxidase n=1 Tax=Platanthera guangdongensis TaxID=2320717 RepID=A0ABR2LNE3_9ASPA